jgi:hypothetical protein
MDDSSLLGIAITTGVEGGLSENEGDVEGSGWCDRCIPLTVTRRFLDDGGFVVGLASWVGRGGDGDETRLRSRSSSSLIRSTLGDWRLIFM